MSAAARCAPLLAALVLAACGGGDDPAPPAATQVAQAPVATPTPTASLAAPAQTAPPQATASAEPPAAMPADADSAPATPTPDKEAIARQTPPPTATPVPKNTATPTPTPTPRPAKLNGPLTCLKQAKLTEPKKSGTGLWSGSLRRATDVIAVDGPYPSPRDAQLSVQSLEGASDAEVGGNYVVSANRSSKAKATVSKVADCLDERDS